MINENTNNRRGFLKAFSASAVGLGVAASLSPAKILASDNKKINKLEISIHPDAVKRTK